MSEDRVINAHRSQVFGVSEGLIDDKHIHKRLSINTRYLQHTYFNTMHKISTLVVSIHLNE